jgi:pSer/pThr/pTyr-binding forkhead associated (FHA) protein
MSALVVEVVEGPDAGVQRPVAAGLELGRETKGFVLHDQLASRRHARLSLEDSGVTIEDLGSTNGTLVNGHEIHGPTLVSSGDTILIGVTVLQLRTAEDVAVRPTATRPVPPPLAVPAQPPRYVSEELARVPRQQPELDLLLDARVKWRARIAPLGLLVVIALAVMLYLGLR